MKFRGKVWKFGDNIDTDAIIPARYLVSSDPTFLAAHCMEDADPEFVKKISAGDIIVAGDNFGCGSSREHAPLALQVAGVNAVVAQTYARIFYRNSVDGGFVMPLESVENIFEHFKTGDEVVIDLEQNEITNSSSGESFKLHSLGDAAEIINAGGLFPYARKIGMIAPVNP